MPNNDSIKSFVRIKPSLDIGDDKLISTMGNTLIMNKTSQEYEFNHIFSQDATNQHVFNLTTKPIIQHNFHGFNSCILAYGQTASGKTYTMKGQPYDMGIIPRTVKEIFATIENKKLTAEVRISYLEIYNENIIDLLSDKTSSYLTIKEDCKKNITINQLVEERVASEHDALTFFQIGEQKRKFASTNVNFNSSRSHTIFRIYIEVVHDKTLETTVSHLNMVDLAGSQGVSKTKAEGFLKKEGENINKSLLSLSNVIRSMSDKCDYVNFRDSKLTRILQSSLCTNSKSIVICTINPNLSNIAQTQNTLKFGLTASKINVATKQNSTASALQRSQKKSFHLQILPSERIQLQGNRRIIDQLQQEITSLKLQKDQLQGDLYRTQCENMNLINTVEKYGNQLKDINSTKVQATSHTLDGWEHFHKENRHLKEEINILIDRYDEQCDYVSKLEKNQRYLLDRIAKFQSQIKMLNEATQKRSEKAAKTRQAMPKTIPSKRTNEVEQPTCIFTLNTIVSLKAKMIELKREYYQSIQEIARLMQTIQKQNEVINELQQEARPRRSNVSYTQLEQKEIKRLNRKIGKMKREEINSKRREEKLRNILKHQADKGIHALDEFGEWLGTKNKAGNKVPIEESTVCSSEPMDVTCSNLPMDVVHTNAPMGVVHPNAATSNSYQNQPMNPPMSNRYMKEPMDIVCSNEPMDIIECSENIPMNSHHRTPSERIQ